jgi:hypothetical protein
MDRLRWRSFARHHQRRLAGERGGEKAGGTAGLVCVDAKLSEGVFDDRRLSRSRVAEHAEDLLVLGAIEKPVLQLVDCAFLLV